VKAGPVRGSQPESWWTTCRRPSESPGSCSPPSRTRWAIRKPRVLFPTVTDTLAGVKSGLHPVCPRAHVILSRADALYRKEEYRLYLDHLPDDRLTVTTLDVGHDWPVTRPALLERMVTDAAALLRQEAATASASAARVGSAPSDGERTRL
jgi:hypothetical protein